MKKEAFELAQLISGYLRNVLSEDEENHLMQILQRDENTRKLLEYYKHTASAQERLNYMNSLDIDAAWNKVSRRHEDKSKRDRWYGLLKYVAVFAILVSSAALWVFYSKKESKAVTNTALKYKNDVLPGSKVAILVLSNGKKVRLDGRELALQEKDGTKLKGSEGALTYAGNQPSDREEVLYNRLIVPPAGTYSIQLPDGTNVWLNATSELRFPLQFNTKERKVELIGEAYFEVAKNKKVPFKVLTHNQEIEVSGTHFNVNSYADEDLDKTTLLEGAVNVSNLAAPAKSYQLKPGEQAQLNKNTSETQVKTVNTEEAVAWKNGYFIFNDEKLESIMRKVARWYDVEIYYEGKLGDESFLGVVERSKNISSLLKVLELTENVHFKISGRRIVVMP